MRARPSLAFSLLAFLSATLSCSSDAPKQTAQPTCALAGQSFPAGDPDGHADPFGAKAAGQARAARLKDASGYPQPAHGRQQIKDGDFVLINDRIAVAIEDKGLSDGYGRFGGEILAIDRVGDDGKPMGLSKYNETLVSLSLDTVNPTSVSVLADGSDGGEAIVRVSGPLETIPFVAETLKALYPNVYDVQVAFDYVLAPHSNVLGLRLGVLNPGTEDIDFGASGASQELYGFFQTSQAQLVTPEKGYATPAQTSAWVGYDAGAWSFAWRTTADPPMRWGVEQAGFQLFTGPGFVAPACKTTQLDRVQIIAGGPEYDGLREAVREASSEAAWRAITGTVKDAKGAPVAGAYVHGLGADGAYLTRTKTAADGRFTIHAPPGAAMTLVPQKQGYPTHAGTSVAAATASADLSFAPEATIHVLAKEAGSGKALPVRVQVIPKVPVADEPEAWGVQGETNGRLWQEFAVSGEATLPVPPGEHRVIVTRGYEYELLDQTVTVAAGEKAEITADLAHSVDSTGVMCADFHIHSMHSADSNDPVVYKVKGAIADGLDIPVSSEHEWVIDFQPEIVKLGLTDWAFGMASSELTTFTWGHFGVVPLTPRGASVNNGAVEWIGNPPRDVFATAHALPEAPIVIVNHPRSSGFQGYFTAAGYDRATNAGDPSLWSDTFEAIEVFNDADFESNRAASVADWFAFLNLGRKMVAVGSSDSHHLRSGPVGYPRTCLRFGHDDPKKLTPNAVRDAVAKGNAIVSGGLSMTVTGPGGERPGDALKVPAGGAAFTITVQSPSWLSGDVTLETIVDGKTIATTPLTASGTGSAKRYEKTVTVSAADLVAGNDWVVFHAKTSADLSPLHPGRRPFAVSNAIFLSK
jgi:hypothetical protein